MTLMFCMIHLVPGDPARIMLGPRATPEMIADISMRMGLDQPLIIQLIKFLGNILKGDLGVDVLSSRPVTEIVFGFGILIGLKIGHKYFWNMRRSAVGDRADEDSIARVLLGLLVGADWKMETTFRK